MAWQGSAQQEAVTKTLRAMLEPQAPLLPSQCEPTRAVPRGALACGGLQE